MAGAAHAVTPATLLNATASEPRAFGYQVGDAVSRTVSVHAPQGLVLDEASLPQPGARGRALELRSAEIRSQAEPGGRRIELSLTYQVFLAPMQVRTLETPTFTLRFQGQPRAQEVRVEAWPISVSPLLPVEASARRGLGDLRPDTPPPLIDTAAVRIRMAAYAAVGLLLLGYLGYVYFGLPWRARGRWPFTLAWRALRSSKAASAEAQRRDAFARLHEALNQTAGEVVFEQGIERFVSAHPRRPGQLLRTVAPRVFRAGRTGHVRQPLAAGLVSSLSRCGTGRSVSFDRPWLLGLLLLALLPLLARRGAALNNAWPALMLRDWTSDALGWVLRGAGALFAAGAVRIFALEAAAIRHRFKRVRPAATC